MTDNFILLTTGSDEPYPIIIGVSNIASVQPLQSNPGQTIITLNFATEQSSSPMRVLVNETFEQIKSMLGL